jgi:hypothetical protein
MVEWVVVWMVEWVVVWMVEWVVEWMVEGIVDDVRQWEFAWLASSLVCILVAKGSFASFDASLDACLASCYASEVGCAAE